MQIIRNEKGVTLIEVLVSMVLLSIIFISVMKFFPQMGSINKQNEDKTQAINIAKEILINWQESSEVKWFLVKKDQVTGFTSVDAKVDYTNFHYDDDYYYFETSKDKYTVHIKVNKSPTTSSKLSSVHSIGIKLFNKNGNVVTDTYGYVKR
jgi:prepilin-type N-terminal cleavage/methylation domain-containing protein